MTFGDADARTVEVGAALAVDLAEVLPVEAGAEAFALCRAVVAGEALVVPVCVLVDAGGV